MHRSRSRFVPVIQLVRSLRPDIADPAKTIAERRLLVDDRFVTNPRALVRAGAPVTLEPVRKLRGEDKLRVALDGFAIDVRDRVCLDIGASAGGFTRVLIERGARRVFALDVGFGQLRGDLRSHSRVVNLERTNIAALAASPVRCTRVDVVTMDLSYLSIADAVPQLEAIRIAPDANLVALVKPMYELGLASPPQDERSILAALEAARRGIEAACRWRVTGSLPSPVTGSRGARELLLHAGRSNETAVGVSVRP
ncbi:MAG TPA: SAM-dependent methyltransferase [Actinomycetota bacterium]|nr:SAM-dependent methyltransferase [Actinomycetota bacterium]